jgi:hypothetical protein
MGFSITVAETHTSISNLFNEREYSDCQVLFKKSGSILHLHKNIICTQSGFFKACFASGMIETVKNIVEIDDEDERLVTILLQSLYTSKLTGETTDLAPLTLIAEKYLMIASIPVLTDCLASSINDENALQCLHLDLDAHENVKKSLEKYLQRNSSNILEGNTYLSLEIQHFFKAIGMLVNATNGMKGIEAVHLWIEKEEEERAKYSLMLTREVQKATNRVAVQHVRFDLNHCSSSIVLSENSMRATGYGRSSVLGTACSRYTIRILDPSKHLMVGFAASISENPHSFVQPTGFYMYCCDGTLCGQGGSGQYYATRCYKRDTVIEAIYENETIRFVVNGNNLGVAFARVPSKLYPALHIASGSASFELI